MREGRGANSPRRRSALRKSSRNGSARNSPPCHETGTGRASDSPRQAATASRASSAAAERLSRRNPGSPPAASSKARRQRAAVARTGLGAWARAKGSVPGSPRRRTGSARALRPTQNPEPSSPRRAPQPPARWVPPRRSVAQAADPVPAKTRTPGPPAKAAAWASSRSGKTTTRRAVPSRVRRSSLRSSGVQMPVDPTTSLPSGGAMPQAARRSVRAAARRSRRGAGCRATRRAALRRSARHRLSQEPPKSAPRSARGPLTERV